jgi:NOT2 / NOT3 / NOT5 family
MSPKSTSAATTATLGGSSLQHPPARLIRSSGEDVALPVPASTSTGDGIALVAADSVLPAAEASAIPATAAHIPSIASGDRDRASDTSALAAEQLADGEACDDLSERYGMKGLLRVLKPGSEPTDHFLLSIGLDLTMLGLNLNSPEPLHAAFLSPWDENQSASISSPVATGSDAAQIRNGEHEYKLPECYYMQPPALKTSHFAKFQLETLFYVFYNMPGDVLQLLAAVELNNRDWRYHKDLKLWFTRAPGTVPSYENGSYIYFDISNWERQPFHDGANVTFVKGLMTEDELRGARIPMSSLQPASS